MDLINSMAAAFNTPSSSLYSSANSKISFFPYFRQAELAYSNLSEAEKLERLCDFFSGSQAQARLETPAPSEVETAGRIQCCTETRATQKRCVGAVQSRLNPGGTQAADFSHQSPRIKARTLSMTHKAPRPSQVSQFSASPKQFHFRLSQR